MRKVLLFVVAVIVFFSLSFAYADTSTSASRQYDDSSLHTVDNEPTEKSVNLRVFIPGLFVGYVGGVWDIAVSPSLSLGPLVRIFVFGHHEGYDFGLNMNYALSGNLFRSGFVLNPYIEYYHGNYNQPPNIYGIREKVGTIVAGVNLMYQWMFHSGFNIMAGLGLEYADEEIPVTMLGNSDIHGHFEVTIGYAF